MFRASRTTRIALASLRWMAVTRSGTEAVYRSTGDENTPYRVDSTCMHPMGCDGFLARDTASRKPAITGEMK